MKRQPATIAFFVGLTIVATSCIVGAIVIYWYKNEAVFASALVGVATAAITGMCGVARQENQYTETTFTDMTSNAPTNYTQVETESQRTARLRRAERARRQAELDEEYSDVSEEQEVS
jgi:hypothetical protein